MTAGLTLITGTFFRFVARRLDTRPEDYEDAEISDGAGELGFYSPHSWWPIMIALSASVTAVGVALWLPWLLVAGVVFVLASVGGPRLRVLHRRREALIALGPPNQVTSGLQLVTYRAAEFDPLIGLGRVAGADSEWLSAACCRADEVVEKDRRK